MKFILIKFIIPILILLFSTQLQNTYCISGRMYSDDGELLKNGFLTLENNNKKISAITDSLGKFKITDLQKGLYKIHFEIMKGYYYKDTSILVNKSMGNFKMIVHVFK